MGKLESLPDNSVPADTSSTDTPSTDTPSAAALTLSSTYGGKVSQIYEQALKGYSVEMSEAQAQALSQDSRVKYVEEDGIMSASTIEQASATWGLDRVDQRGLPLNGD